MDKQVFTFQVDFRDQDRKRVGSKSFNGTDINVIAKAIANAYKSLSEVNDGVVQMYVSKVSVGDSTINDKNRLEAIGMMMRLVLQPLLPSEVVQSEDYKIWHPTPVEPIAAEEVVNEFINPAGVPGSPAPSAATTAPTAAPVSSPALTSEPGGVAEEEEDKQEITESDNPFVTVRISFMNDGSDEVLSTKSFVATDLIKLQKDIVKTMRLSPSQFNDQTRIKVQKIIFSDDTNIIETRILAAISKVLQHLIPLPSNITPAEPEEPEEIEEPKELKKPEPPVEPKQEPKDLEKPTRESFEHIRAKLEQANIIISELLHAGV